MTHVELKWLKSPPAAKGGVTWGVPWEKGVLQKEEQLSIAAPGGSAPVLQSRPLAYWPDGSVKWTVLSCKKADKRRLKGFFKWRRQKTGSP